MKIKITASQIQKQVLAPSMQQSIEILLLPLIELNTAIELELQENPLLEIVEDRPMTSQSPLEDLVNQNLKRLKDSAVDNSQPAYFSQEEEDSEEKEITRSAPLEEYLLQQLRIEITDPLDLKIGEFIIGNLDEDGFFRMSCEETALMLGLKSAEIVERILHTIQNFEPLGVAARDLKECLSVQAHFKFNDTTKDLICKVINDHLEELGRKKYAEIARKLKLPLTTVKKITQEIASLEPRPARKYRPTDTNIYVRADVTITKNSEGEYEVRINNDSIPHLRINAFYQNMLKQPNRTPEEIEFIREKVKNGILFIKSIEQRHQTIRDITHYLVEYQKDFLEDGPLHLRPMILKDVADSIGRNESTVCRAINNKYVETPQGLFPMKFFFSQALSENTLDGKSVSSRSIKEEIKTLIEEENKVNPLSDQDIQNYFKEKGMPVARRTISKYRQAMRILPSHLRKI